MCGPQALDQRELQAAVVDEGRGLNAPSRASPQHAARRVVVPGNDALDDCWLVGGGDVDGAIAVADVAAVRLGFDVKPRATHADGRGRRDQALRSAAPGGKVLARSVSRGFTAGG